MSGALRSLLKALGPPRLKNQLLTQLFLGIYKQKRVPCFAEPFCYKFGDYRILSRVTRDSHNQQYNRRLFIQLFSQAYTNKKGFRVLQNPFVISLATTYSPTISSTIGADGFNFSVRNGKRWSPAAIVTLRSFEVRSLKSGVRRIFLPDFLSRCAGLCGFAP